MSYNQSSFAPESLDVARLSSSFSTCAAESLLSLPHGLDLTGRWLCQLPLS